MNYYVDQSFLQLNCGNDFALFILKTIRKNSNAKIYISINALDTLSNQSFLYKDVLRIIYKYEKDGFVVIAFPEQLTSRAKVERTDLEDFAIVEKHCAPDNMIYVTANLANYYRANLIVGNDSIQYIPC